VTEIFSVIQDFGNRFCNFQKIRTVVEYLSFPFKSDLNTEETAASIRKNYSLGKPSPENKILTLKIYIFLKTRAGQESFWKLVAKHKFPQLQKMHILVSVQLICVNLRFLTYK
jgi:hypothetical protein